MGLCISLPHLNEHHVHAVQSANSTDPCAMFAVPERMTGGDIPPSPPTPKAA